MLYLDDLTVGQRFAGGSTSADAPQIKAFAGPSDPQPFHLDDEAARARAGASGMSEVGVVTVWERPTRVIVTATFLGSAALLDDPWPTLGAAAWVGLGVVGLAQLLVVVRRRLT